MKYIKVSEYAKLEGLHVRTITRHYHEGKIPGKQLETGTILLEDPRYKEEEKNLKRVVLYARVSSSQNKDNLESQLERLRLYATAKGYTIVKEVKEVGSGLNDKRKKLEKVLKEPDGYDILLVEHKDRLTRFGFNYIEVLFISLKKELEVINIVEDVSSPYGEDKEDLVQDFVSIITSFCARIYGKRRGSRKTEKLIKSLSDDVIND